MKFTLRSLASAAALFVAGTMMANVYIGGQSFGWGQYEVEGTDGDYSYTFTGNEKFKVSNGNGDNWESKALLPKGWTSGDYWIGAGKSFEYEEWGSTNEAPCLYIYQPGTYTVTVDTNAKTVSVSGTPDDSQIRETWFLVGANFDYKLWAEGDVPFDASVKNGIYTLKRHVDKLDGEFTIVRQWWGHENQFRYLDGDCHIGDFGTYPLKNTWDGCSANTFNEGGLSNLDITVVWDPSTKETAAHPVMTLSESLYVGSPYSGWGRDRLDRNDGIYTYNFPGNGKFKFNTGSDWERGALVPKGWTSGDYYLGVGKTVEYEVWDRDGDAPCLNIYQPGNYVVTVNTNTKTISVAGTMDTTPINTWWLGGQGGLEWDPNKYPFEMSCNDKGVYTNTLHLDRDLPNDDFAFYLDGGAFCVEGSEVSGYGTYNLNFNGPASKIKDGVTVGNVDITVVWDTTTPEGFYHPTVTFTECMNIEGENFARERLNNNDGVYTYTFTNRGKFKVSSGLGDQWDARAFVPKGWTSGDYWIGVGKTVEYEKWGQDGEAPCLYIYQPGTYTVTVDTNAKTISIDGTTDDTQIVHNFYLAGDNFGWDLDSEVPAIDDVTVNNGVYTIKKHLDNINGNFVLLRNNWDTQKFHYHGTIEDYGTYAMEHCYTDCPATTFKEGGLSNVNATFTWDPSSNETASHPTMLFANATVNSTDIIKAGDAEAEYFSISGVRVAANQLTPGLYICRKGGKTSKVIVK